MIVASAKEGLDCLHSVLSTQLEQLTEPLGYVPKVIWNISEELKNPPADKVWLMVANNFTEDTRANIGRPRRYEVIGFYNVIFHYPQSPLVFCPVDDVAERIKCAYYEQNLLRPYNVIGAMANDVDPVEQWNRKQLAINYRFQYFVN